MLRSVVRMAHYDAMIVRRVINEMLGPSSATSCKVTGPAEPVHSAGHEASRRQLGGALCLCSLRRSWHARPRPHVHASCLSMKQLLVAMTAQACFLQLHALTETPSDSRGPATGGRCQFCCRHLRAHLCLCTKYCCTKQTEHLSAL